MAKKNMKTRRQRGGATPYYSFGSAVAPGAPYASKVVGHETVDVARPGALSTAPNGMLASAGTGGLPGFTGGGRRRRRGSLRLGKMFRNAVKSTRKFFKRLTGRRKQRGGRYTVDLASGVGSTGPNVFAPVSRMACEGGMYNTSPPGALPNPTQPMRGGRRRRLKGGAAPLTGSSLTAAPLMGATPENTKFYEVPNAGYRNDASQWLSSTGTPALIQTPYQAGASMSQACLKTGGGRGRKRSKKSRRSRK